MKDRTEVEGPVAAPGLAKPTPASADIDEQRVRNAIEDDDVRECLKLPQRRRPQIKR